MKVPGILLATCLASLTARAAEPIRLDVDLSQATRRIVHATLRIPVTPGPCTLLYPKWLPGDHGPTGPVKDLAGIFFNAGGHDLDWVRDPENMYAFRVEVPAGSSELSVLLDVLMPTEPEGLPEGSSVSDKLAILNWNHVVLVPAPSKGDAVTIQATLRVPAGWSIGTALPVRSSKAGETTFQPVSLTTLLDSPALTGAYFRTIVLDERPGARVVMDLAADAPADLAMPAALEQAFRKLVTESDALFGTRHFADYHFLVALSDQVSIFSLEHHASSDNRFRERSLIDDDQRRLMSDTLAHEYVHSWNGKYKRPAGLRPDDFASPIDSSLLWVYEGLTQYLGWVLTARSGQLSTADSLDTLAVAAAELDLRVGRRWRSLEDTGTAAQILYETPSAWTSWRRSTDFYDEGTLLWLDVDVTIRRLTKNAKSLDDFCKRFLGGGTGRPEVVTYGFDDVVAGLNAVAPHDWATFLTDRVKRRGSKAPLGGIDGGGWKLTFGDAPSRYLEAVEAVDETIDERYSIGLSLDGKGAVVDVVPGSAPWEAGIAPGMKLVAVNERRFSKDAFLEAIAAGKDAPATLALIVENADYFRTVAFDVQGGLRYPVLARGDGPDVLGAILAPKAGTTYNKPATTTKR
jgi:predicted metalloprotease with PDZ domain